jgi:2-keto-4-pentenoate hydratase
MTVMADGDVARLADSLWRTDIDRSPISPITDAYPGWAPKMLSAGGWHLKPGALVLSGGLTTPVPVRQGAVVCAEFDGLGAVEVYG